MGEGEKNDSSAAGAAPFDKGLTHQPALKIVARLRAFPVLGGPCLEAADEIERLLGANIVLLAGLHKICEPITAMGDADSVSACQDLHELICMTAQEAISAAATTKSDAVREMEKAMGPRENPLHPMFRDHNCAYCASGEKACKQGNPSRCEYPHARND